MANRPNRASDNESLISVEDKARIDMLRIQVNSLVTAGQEEVMKQQLRTLHESFLAACTTGDVLSYAVESLMDNCLESQSLCNKVAIMFQVLSVDTICQRRVRSVILTCLQNNFRKMKELQETNNEQWLNSIVLFVAIFRHFRYPNGKHVLMLAKFVIQALQPLLLGDEPEMKLLAESVILNGLILKEGAPEELDQLLVDIRTTLIQRNLSSECRLWLLLTADVAELNFGSLRLPILKFYKEHLGEKIVPIINTGANNIYSVNPENSAGDVSSSAAISPKSPTSPVSVNASRKSPDAADSGRKGSSDRRSKEPSYSRSKEPSYSPRSKDDLVDKVRSVRISSDDRSEKSRNFAGAINYVSKSKGHWDHDDRFSNTDYEAPKPRPDRAKGKKSSESPEKSELSNRSDRSGSERTKVLGGNWRQPPSKERGVQPSPKIIMPPSDESWD